MVISISGVPGSGKTSTGKILAERLGLKFYSMGELRAKMAMEKGLTLDQLNALGEKDYTTDTDVDEFQRELGEKEDNFVIEGRLSWYFIPQSVKIWLDCDADEAAKRIFDDPKYNRPDEPLYKSVTETKEALARRVASDVTRYRKFYSIDHQDKSRYDLVLDTTANNNPSQTADLIIAELKKIGKI